MGDGFVVIGGVTYFFGESTAIEGTLEVGAMAEVEYVVQADGSFLATKIEVEDPDEDSDEDPDDDSDEDSDEGSEEE